MTISTNTYFDTSINENSYNQFLVIRETKYPEIKKDLEILINKYNEFFEKTNLSAKIKIAYIVCLEVELKILLDKCLDENGFENEETKIAPSFIEKFLGDVDKQKIALEKILNDDSKNLPELKEPKEIKSKIYDDLTIEAIILNSRNDELHLVYENFSKFFLIYTENHARFKSIRSFAENNLNALKGLQNRVKRTIHKIAIAPNSKIHDDVKNSFISLNKKILCFLWDNRDVNIIAESSIKLI